MIGKGPTLKATGLFLLSEAATARRGTPATIVPGKDFFIRSKVGLKIERLAGAPLVLAAQRCEDFAP